MATKKTIAIISSAKRNIKAIVNRIDGENYRILLMSKNENQFIQLTSEIKNKIPNIEVDVIDCMKDGCWEADIIILDISRDEENEVAEKIKEVATQKIVVVISNQENSIGNEVENLQRLLPHSKVVKVFNISGQLKIFNTGNDEEASETVSNIFKIESYHSLSHGK